MTFTTFLVLALAPLALSRTVTFYGVKNGPAGLAGSTPTISPIRGVDSGGTTTYEYKARITAIPTAVPGPEQTIDFGNGFPFGGLFQPIKVPGPPKPTYEKIKPTTITATLYADATRNVLEFHAPRPTGTGPHPKSFVQDCSFDTSRRDARCTYLQGGFSSNRMSSNSDLNFQTFDGPAVPLYSAVI